MADVWSRIGIKPYEVDPSKVKLPLDDAPKAAPAPRTPQNTDRNIGQMILDTDAQFGRGAGSLVQTIGDIGQLITGNQNSLQSYGQEVKDFWGNYLSPQYKEGSRRIDEAIKSKDGEIAQAVEALKQYATHPSQLVGTIVESTPTMVVGGIPGKAAGTIATGLNIGAKGVTRASVAGAAAGESVIQGGQTGGEVLRGDLNTALNPDETPKYSKEETLSRARRAAIGSGATTAATYLIPGSTTIERGIMGIENKTGTRTANAVKGLFGEAAQEGTQGITGQMSQNYAEDKPLMQGTGAQGATGALIGAAMGGAIGATNNATNATDIPPKPKKPSETINIDEETKAEAARQTTTWAEQRAAEVKQEAAAVKAQAAQMINEGMDPASVRATLDNLITPSAADVKLTQLLNGGNQLPSQMSGMRIVPIIEDTIQASIDHPELARTNQELEEVLRMNGMGKELLQVISASYAAKDPEILKQHIYSTLVNNTDQFVDHAPIQEAIMQQVAQMDAEHEAAMAQVAPVVEAAPNDSETLSNNSETIVNNSTDTPNEVMFKQNPTARAVRGELFDLPFGLKGVIVYDKKGGGTIFEYESGSYLYQWSKGSSYGKEYALEQSIKKVEKMGEEKLMAGMQEWRDQGKIANPEIVYAKAKKDENAPKKGYEERTLHFNDGSTEVTQGKSISLAHGFKGFIHHKDGNWRVSEDTTGMALSDYFAKQDDAIKQANERIEKHGQEKLQKVIDSEMTSRRIKTYEADIEKWYDGMSDKDRKQFWLDKFYEQFPDREPSSGSQAVIDQRSMTKYGSLDKDTRSALGELYDRGQIDTENNKYIPEKRDTISNDSDIIVKDSKTIVKGGEDETVQPVRDNNDDRAEANGATEVRPNEVGNPGRGSSASDEVIDGAQTSTVDPKSELRDTKPSPGNSGGDDAVSQRAEPVERQQSPERTDTDNAGAGNDTVARGSDEQNLDLRGKDPIYLTKGERKKINEQAKELLDRGAPYSEAEKDILRQYTGEGGLSSGETKEALTQHYTDYTTIQAIYDALEASGFNPKTALEPAVGSGNFVGMRPDLKWTTVDIDATNHAVVNALYPQANNYHNGFEEFKGKGFDLIISNVPFLEERGAGLYKDRPDIKMLHDYYFAAAMDKVNDNGIVAFVTSKGTMDKADSAIRREIVSKGDIIGAYRLPGGTFSKNAHTDVITDIIFIQKRPDGIDARPEREADNLAFISSSKTKDDIYLNDYYQNHTSHILGDVKVGVNKLYGGRLAYEISGTPDYSRMKIDYTPYTKDKTKAAAAEESAIPTDSKEFEQWAKDNGIEWSKYDSGGIVIDGNKVLSRTTVEFDDIKGAAYMYEPLEDQTIADKILSLDKIREAGEANNIHAGQKLIEQYKTKFKTHPKKDKALGKVLRAAGEDQKYYEYGSFFNDKFEPSDIFREQTRYTGSGKIDITPSSPLKDRLFHEENNEGIVDIGDSKLIDKKEFAKILKDPAYSYLGGDRFQNAILYYSGNIYDKIDAMEALQEEHMDDEAVVTKIDEQIAKLREIMPEPKKVDEIAFKGTEKWISDAGIPIPFSKKEKTENVAGGGTKTTMEWTSGYGKVFDNYLNGKQLITAKDEESMSSFKNRLREAQQEVQGVLDRYRDWLARGGHTETFEKAYNKRYNGYVQPDYLKASYLIQDTLDALPAELKLRSNQIRWIMQAYYEGKGINAHDVGGGKTLAGVVLAKVLKDKGAAKKPIFVVPSKVIKNWVKEIQRAVPDAKIVDLGNLPKEKRETMLYDLANTNADYVLISKEGFETLKLPKATEAQYARELLNENLRNDQLKGRALQVMNEKVNRYLSVLEADNKNQSITIDKLGIDAIFADEARSYKNIGVSSELVGNKLGKAFGLNINDKTGSVSIDSATAYDFRFKTRYISERNSGKNVFLLDATPTPNKPIEIFTMLKHLDNGIFEEYGIETDRDFANMFFEFGLKPTKTGSMEKGLIALKNAFGLKAIMNRYINRISMGEFASQKIIDLPEEKVVNHYLDQTEEGEMVFEEISRRMAEAKADREKRKEMPGIFSNGITASVDPRLYQRMGITDIMDPTPDNHKIEKVVSLVVERRSKNKRAGQIIFLDSAGHTASSISEVKDKDGNVTAIYPATLEENLHQDIKNKLIKSGKYKANEIAILSGQEITDPKTGKETKATGNRAQQLKQDIVDAYDNGQIKVIIGTTKSAGEGMNIQKFTTDIYHVDLPWTIAEVIQRNGRGVRYGNENSSVNTHYFFQAGTFDSLMYKTVMNKKGWNEALWDTQVSDRMEVVDEGGSMPSPAEIMLAMEKDPIKRRKLELEIEHQRLSDEYNNVTDEVNAMNRRIKLVEQEIRDENGKQRDLEERMKDPTPTKELKELQEKALKEPKKYQEKFKEVQDRVKAHQNSMHTQRVEKIARLGKELEARKAQLEKGKGTLNDVSKTLREFEDKHMDNRGNFITEVEC